MPPYGDMFRIDEVLLFYFHEKPGFFARVENVEPDRKKGWWQLTFLVLSVPLQQMTWILDDDQIRGSDFTMSGEPIHIERVKSPDPSLKPSPHEEAAEAEKRPGGGKVVSMFDDE